HYDMWEREGITPKDICKRAGAHGFLCTWADEQYCGAGCRDFRYDQIVAEELANTPGVAFGVHAAVAAPYLDRLGSEEQEPRLPGFERGSKLEQLGCHAQDTAGRFFRDVAVPCANVLGDPRMGLQAMKELLVDERLAAACGSLALARAAFDATLPYVKERK